MSNIIQFVPKKKTYSGVVEPSPIFSSKVVTLTKEQAVVFYANYIFTFSCSSHEQVIKWAKKTSLSIKQCQNSFLIFHDGDYTYINLKKEIKVDTLQMPTENCDFHKYIENSFELCFHEEENKFFTYEDDSLPTYARKLFIMPEAFKD